MSNFLKIIYLKCQNLRKLQGRKKIQKLVETQDVYCDIQITLK
jgi:hypothetical protein